MLHVRIKIMEDVVRRVKDPALRYHRKRETVDELEGYLHRMRALVSDTVADVGSQTGIAVLPLERRQDVPAAGSSAVAPEQGQNVAQIARTLARMRDAKVVAVLRGKNPQR